MVSFVGLVALIFIFIYLVHDLSTLALLTFWAREFFVLGICLVIVGGLGASLTSTHKSYDNHKTSPNAATCLLGCKITPSGKH